MLVSHHTRVFVCPQGRRRSRRSSSSFMFIRVASRTVLGIWLLIMVIQAPTRSSSLLMMSSPISMSTSMSMMSMSSLWRPQSIPTFHQQHQHHHRRLHPRLCAVGDDTTTTTTTTTTDEITTIPAGSTIFDDYDMNEDKEAPPITVEDNDNNNDTTNTTKKRRRMIEIKSAIELPVSRDMAYTAYSTLSRQPEWSSWLVSVDVLPSPPSDDNDDENEDKDNNQLTVVRSKWTTKVMGFTYSWEARARQNKRTHTMVWTSVTGLYNAGVVHFYPKKKPQHTQDNTTNGSTRDETIDETGPTLMTITTCFAPPRAVSSLFKRSKTLSNYVEQYMIGQSLIDFCRIIAGENNINAQ